MKHSCLLALLVVLTGCQLPEAGLPTSLQLPEHEQHKPVVVFNPLQISLSKAYWTDTVMKPGFASVPESIRDQQRALFSQKARSKFLVVETVIVNTGNRPAEWPRLQVPIFTVESASGSVYVADTVTGMENPTAVVRMGRALLNPGESLPGKLVFDVPPGSYRLNFAIADQLDSLGGASARRNMFRWKLNPTE